MSNENHPLSRRLLCLVCGLASGVALATEVYRWTDENGLVHFGSRPPSAFASERRVIEPGKPAVVDQSTAERRRRQQRTLEAYEYDRNRKKQQAQQAEAARARQAKRCRQIERRWRQLSHPGPLYTTDSRGERHYLSDSEREAEKAKLTPRYREVCGESP